MWWLAARFGKLQEATNFKILEHVRMIHNQWKSTFMPRFMATLAMVWQPHDLPNRQHDYGGLPPLVVKDEKKP